MTLSLNASATALATQTGQWPPLVDSGAAQGSNTQSSQSARPGADQETAGSDAAANRAYSLSTTTSAPTQSPEQVAGVVSDIDGDGARLMALQVQQALAAQPSSIANASTQSVLALFAS